MIDERVVDTPRGPGRLVQRRPPSPWATLVLGHGAGGGIDAPDLDRLFWSLPREGITVALVEQPWRYAGKRVAPAPAVLDEGFHAIVSRLRARTPMVVGGRSAGARVAARTGRGLGAVGVLALAYPLHPPSAPHKSRLDDLTSSRLPSLVLQGTRDAFGAPQVFPREANVVPIHDADHGFAVPKRSGTTQEQALDLVVLAALGWMQSLVGGRR